MMNVNSVAALMALPIGTKLKIVRTAKGKCAPSGRIFSKVNRRNVEIEMTVDDPSSKYNGQSSSLPLMGSEVVPTDNGFRIVAVSNARVLVEYEFSEAA